jgi:hypothetical protein
MSEVEKMYRNAGIKPLCQIPDGYCGMKNVYEDFTAEKQLELIKWLGDTDYYIHSIYKTIDTKEYCIENDFYDIQTNKFEEALARLINKLWRDLTKAERKQIKEILSE